MVAAQLDYVGQYELLRLLGHGAFCAVYEARDRATGERVALKQLRRVGPVSLSNFKREFRAVQGLHHPSVVELRELFEFGGTCFIAMELIEGSDLITHLRGGAANSNGRVDWNRLSLVFLQLTEALVALHEAGVVHRDLKPSNVLVTAKGRVVLLDFGLIKTHDSSDVTNTAGVGTAIYMAPEQAAGRATGFAADFYSLGVCLFEAITGSPPFDARSPLDPLAIQRDQKPIAPSERAAHVPVQIDRLCARLLDPTPSARPSAAELIQTFSTREITAPLPLIAATPSERFAGRENELAALQRAFTAAQSGIAIALVEGESGIGKSALVVEFLRQIGRERPEPLLLRSRCYENELLAYKAFDGGMEQLAHALSLLERADCRALAPPRALLLPRLFGALSTVPALFEGTSQPIPAEPSAQRSAAFDALARLLGAIARTRPLVLAIDDLHWADPESFRLLHALVEHPAAPPLLVIATVRSASERSEEAAEAIATLQRLPCVCTIALEGLAPQTARELARDWLHDKDASILDALVRESSGHPLFLSELVRYAERGTVNDALVTLDAALSTRIASLSEPSERLLSVVALAGRPYSSRVLAAAIGLELSEATELATELLQAKLLQRRRRDELACFHDRIRHVAVARLSRERTREIHAGLARALARWPDADPAAIASHCDAAGLIDEAVAAYARAGQHALTALAFARAEQLFARALELAADGGKASVLVPLEMARGHALARAGKSAEAAAQYSSAARRVEGEDRTRLRIWAAQHLLQSARVAEGMDAVRALLSELDLPLPASAAATLASLMWDRACLRLSGLQMLPALRAIGVQERMQLDALWGLAMPVSWLEPLTSALLSTRHLRLARKFGEPAHMARALAEEAFTRTIQQPNDPEADVLLARARSLFRDREDPALEVRLSFREATVATFRWDLPRARERLEHAQRIGTERCPDQPWLVTNVRTNLASLLTTMGDHAQHVSETSAWLDEARDRNDQFALTVIEAVGIGILRHLVADDPDRARLQLTAALAPWPAQPFSFVHLGELISLSYSELYRGGIGARTWFDREASRLSRAFLLKTGLGKAALLMFRACSFLAARAVTPAQAPQLTAAAASCAEKLRAIPLTLAHINATCIEAQVAAVSGDRAAALDKARACRIESERSSYGFMAHTVEYLEGVLEESAGAERRRAALEFFGAQGWKRPERAVAIMCPAVDSPEVRS